ncbi:MAG: DUF6036 family nucleotidyltransferase [Oscillospiraceae bacterium]|nr:DUF6036 family nucleotidyltransferase [Oscillospiraceae bacterium]
MRELTREDILKYFEEINSRLAAENKHGDIYVVGGAAMTMVFNARTSTYDIDAIFAPKEDLRAIISDIAEKHSLNEDWLNDGAKGFVTDKMKFQTHLSYSNLTVLSVDAESLLAMKLTSARANSKDMDDSIFLMKELGIQNEKELFDIIDTYIHPNQQTMMAKYFTMEAFEKYHQFIERKPSLQDKKKRCTDQSKRMAENRQAKNLQKNIER